MTSGNEKTDADAENNPRADSENVDLAVEEQADGDSCASSNCQMV